MESAEQRSVNQSDLTFWRIAPAAVWRVDSGGGRRAAGGDQLGGDLLHTPTDGDLGHGTKQRRCWEAGGSWTYLECRDERICWLVGCRVWRNGNIKMTLRLLAWTTSRIELPSAELRSTDDNQDWDAVTGREQLFVSKVVKFEMCLPSEWRFYRLVG